MSEGLGFKSGKDLGEAVGVVHDETVTCSACGRRESKDVAREAGWQLDPAVCTDCLRWVAVELGTAGHVFEIRRCRRFWAVREDGELVCLTVYRKGAVAVVDRIERAAALANLFREGETTGEKQCLRRSVEWPT